MPEEPVDIPGTDTLTDGTDTDRRSILEKVEKGGGNGDSRQIPPPPEDIPDDGVRSPMIMP